MRCCSDHVRDAEYIVVTSRGLYIISRVANFRRYGKNRKRRPKLDEKGAIWMHNRIIMIIINCKIALSYSQKWHGDRKCLFSRLLLYLQNFGKGVCKLLNRGQQIYITLLTLPKDGMPFSRKCRPITQYDCYSDLRVSCLRGCAIFLTL